jgi:hypothetical protein
MNNPDNTDQLWENLKAQIRAARGDRESFYTNDENALTQRYGASVCIDPDMEGKATVGVTMHRASVRFTATPADLLTIAAKCIATAIDTTDEQQA